MQAVHSSKKVVVFESLGDKTYDLVVWVKNHQGLVLYPTNTETALLIRENIKVHKHTDPHINEECFIEVFLFPGSLEEFSLAFKEVFKTNLSQARQRNPLLV